MRHRTALALLLVVGIASPAAANFLGSVIRLEVAHPTVSTLISTPTTATVTSAVEFPNGGSDFIMKPTSGGGNLLQGTCAGACTFRMTKR